MNYIYEPQLALLAREPFDDPEYGWSIKYNGLRAGIVKLGKETNIWGRGVAWYNEPFPEVKEKVRLPAGTVLDGEIAIIKPDGRDDFPTIQKRVNRKGVKARQFARSCPAEYIAFDLLVHEYRKLDQVPLIERMDILRGLRDQLGTFQVVQCFQSGTQLFEKVKAIGGIEGIVGKRWNSVVRPGARHPDWTKVRVRQKAYFEVVGFVSQNNRLEAFALATVDGKYSGTVGTGYLNESNRVRTFAIMSSMPDGPRLPGGDSDITWKRTGQQLYIEYSDVSESNKLIHPSIVLEKEE